MRKGKKEAGMKNIYVSTIWWAMSLAFSSFLEIFGILSINLYIISVYHNDNIYSINILLMINEYIINN